MAAYAQYRVDVFTDGPNGKEHEKTYFHSKHEAISYGVIKAKTGTVFLLSHLWEGKYEVIQQLYTISEVV